MTFVMNEHDDTASLQAQLDLAATQRRSFRLPAQGFRLISTGLGYRSNANIIMAGDLYNDHGPLVGTHYCLTNRTGTRLRNVTVQGAGGAFAGADTPASGATRKGLGIVSTDGFQVVGVQTRGPLTGFGLEVKNSTGGHLNNLKLESGLNIPGADGLHFFGACTDVAGTGIKVTSGDDAVSFTCENQESINAEMRDIKLSSLTLNSAAFSCIKFYTSATTGAATIRDISISNAKGSITQGPSGGPLIMRNDGAINGCVIERITIENVDLDFGNATIDGPTAYLTDIGDLTLRNVKLRGRRNGQFLRAVRCDGLTLTGEFWETIPGSAPDGMIQLENCRNYSINVVVRSATGARLGSIRATNPGLEPGTRRFGINSG